MRIAKLMIFFLLTVSAAAWAERMEGGNVKLDYVVAYGGGSLVIQDGAGNIKLFDVKAQPIIGYYDFSQSSIGIGFAYLYDVFAHLPFTLTIYRDGNNVDISWDADLYPNPQIFILEGNGSGQFTNDIASWTSLDTYANDHPGEFVIGDGLVIHNNQVGTSSTESYYRAIAAGLDINSDDGKAAFAAAKVMGSFSVPVGTSDTFFISCPLIQEDASPQAVFGNQALDNDWIAEFSDNCEVVRGSYRRSGAWESFPGVAEQITAIVPGHGFCYTTPTSRYLTFVGEVPMTDFSRDIAGGVAANPAWIGPPYPKSMAIPSAGLNGSNYGIDINIECRAVQFNANAEALNGTDGIALHSDPNAWKEGTLLAPSVLIMQPGRGYYLREPVKDTFTWQLTAPY